MSVDLLLLVVQGQGDDRYAHTQLSLTHVGELVEAISHLPKESAVGIESYLTLGRELTGFDPTCECEHDLIGWGAITQSDDLSASYFVVRWRDLRGLANHDEVAAQPKNRATWAYLDAVLADDGQVMIGVF